MNPKDIDIYSKGMSYRNSRRVSYNVGNDRHGPDSDVEGAALSMGNRDACFYRSKTAFLLDHLQLRAVQARAQFCSLLCRVPGVLDFHAY